MSTKQRHSPDCARLEQLALGGDPGALSEADQRFWADHLAACDECRTEHALLDELRFDGTAPAASPVDELSRRRALKDILDAAQAAPPAAARPVTSHRWQWATAALAACLVVALTVTFWPEGGRHELRAPAAPRPALAGRVLLWSGNALIDGSPLRLDTRLGSGQRIESRSGSAALRLPLGSTLLVGAGSDLRLRKVAGDRVQLLLAEGRLLASVTRRQDRQRFEVQTPSGRIRVKGTAFSLRVTKNFTALRVLRGVVVVDGPGRPAEEVRPGRLVVLGKAVAASLASSPSAGLGVAQQQRTARVLWLLPPADTPRKHATLQLRTTPPGATVLVDETPVGVTPLAARLEPGRRRVAVVLAGHDRVQESLTLAPGALSRRHFELKASLQAVRTPAPVAPTPPTVRPATPPPARRVAERVVTARELLERAQRHRAARRYTGALRAYRELVRRYPASPEGRAALVSQGIILLGPGGDAAGALRVFDRYLALTRRGDLAQEALHGRARALRRLGRRAAEIQALREFLKRWPKALFAPHARKRLGRLTSGTPK